MKRRWLTAPYIIWMLLFTIVPLCIVIYFAFTDSVTGAFTFANIVSILDYASIFLRSIWLSVAATLLCLIIGYPVAYTIAQCKPRTQRILQMLIMLPMCISFLLRTLAWVALLEDTGIINNLLMGLGMHPLKMMYTDFSVMIGMVTFRINTASFGSASAALSQRMPFCFIAVRSRSPMVSTETMRPARTRLFGMGTMAVFFTCLPLTSASFKES